MPREHQESFSFGDDVEFEGELPDPLSDFFRDVSQAWDVPVGERVRLRLRDPSLPELSGKLRLARAPDLPLNPRQPLFLCLNGIEFTRREIASWVLI